MGNKAPQKWDPPFQGLLSDIFGTDHSYRVEGSACLNRLSCRVFSSSYSALEKLLTWELLPSLLLTKWKKLTWPSIICSFCKGVTIRSCRFNFLNSSRP